MKKVQLVTFIACIGIALLNSRCTKEDKDNNQPTIATITTTLPGAVTLTTAVSGGSVISNGGDSVTQRGICFSTSPDPTLTDNTISSGSGNGDFTCNMFNLLPGVTYYIRAYAINGIGTAYGNQVTTKANAYGLLYKIVDSVNAAVFDTFEYGAGKKLVKFYASRGGGSPNNGYTDTFIYSNNQLVKNHYNLGSKINWAAPYAKSEYSYLNGVLAGSMYYLGTANLITTSSYTFDATGKLILIKQTQVNGGVGSYPTYTTKFEYDANDNLTRVIYKDNMYGEYMRREYFDYDNKENPFYQLPWTFDYNVFEENDNRLSKNNPGRMYTYSPTMLQHTYAFRYAYNADGKVAKREIIINGGSTGVKYFLYRYE